MIPETSSFYVCLSVPKITSVVDHDLRVEIISSVADMMLPRDYPFIAALGNDIYEFGDDFSEELLGNVYKGDFRIEKEDRPTAGLPFRAEIKNFEEKLMAIIDKYKN